MRDDARLGKSPPCGKDDDAGGDADREGRFLSDAKAAHPNQARLDIQGRLRLRICCNDVGHSAALRWTSTLMDDGANLLAQGGELRRGLDRPRVTIAGEGVDEAEIVARDDATRPRRHDDQMGAEEQRLLDRMGDEENRLPVRAQTSTSSSCIASRVMLSSAPNGSSISRMAGSVRERPRDSDPLAHAAGELIGSRAGEVLQTHET